MWFVKSFSIKSSTVYGNIDGKKWHLIEPAAHWVLPKPEIYRFMGFQEEYTIGLMNNTSDIAMVQSVRKLCSIWPEPLLNSSGIDAQSRRFRCAIWTAYAFGHKLDRLLVRTVHMGRAHRSHRWGHRFESCCDHCRSLNQTIRKRTKSPDWHTRQFLVLIFSIEQTRWRGGFEAGPTPVNCKAAVQTASNTKGVEENG